MSTASRHLSAMARPAFLLVDVAILVLFSAGFLAASVHPTACWWLQVPAAFLPYLSVMVGLGTVGVTILRNRWLLGIHLVLCVLIALRFSPADRVYANPSATDDVLTIMTLNAGGSDPSQEPATTARIHPLQTAAGMSNPDVIGLQGVSIKAGTEGVSRSNFVVQLSDGGYKPAVIIQPRHQAFYQPVFAKIPVKERTTFRIATGSHSSRIFGSVTTLSWLSKEVVLYNLHFRSFTEDRPWNGNGWLNPRTWPSKWRAYREDFEARAAEAEQVRRVLENEKRPFIVCGDFNSTPHSWVYHHIARGLTDAFSAAGRGWGGTYHARRPLFRIDHVLVSNHWDVRDALVLESAVSDHRPLVATLSLRAKR